MKYKLDTTYTDVEMSFIKEFDCEILSEMNIKADFKENETPKRIFKYFGEYVAEISDSETNEPVWAVMSKYKGKWHYCDYYYTLEDLLNGR